MVLELTLCYDTYSIANVQKVCANDVMFVNVNLLKSSLQKNEA